MRLRRKVDEIEHALGVMLLTRHVDGVRATAEGEKIYHAALQDGSGLLRSGQRAQQHAKKTLKAKCAWR